MFLGPMRIKNCLGLEPFVTDIARKYRCATFGVKLEMSLISYMNAELFLANMAFVVASFLFFLPVLLHVIPIKI